MRKPDDWMPLDVRKYLGDTMHLGREEHGAYFLLIMAYWMRGGSLADSDQELAAIVRASRPDWKRLRDVMEPFFDVRDGRWFHRKIEKELAKARELIEKKSKSGKAGADARWGTDAERNGERMADALPLPIANECQEASQTDAPLPLPKPKKKDIRATRFQEFWDACPKKQAKGDAERFYLKAISLADEETIIVAMRQYAAKVAGKDDEFIKTPGPWLNGKRWLDQPAGASQPSAFQQTDTRGWSDRVRVFREKTLWSPKWGPKPGEPDCKCPPELLKEAA